MEKPNRPTILITNDDSVYSKGICELIKVAREFGNVVVVAPDRVRSGMSRAITHAETMHLNKLHEEDGFIVYSSSGTPVDCVKLAFFALFKENKPDLLISGINHGSNSSVNAVYSATVGAAMEGCINNVSSVALSLCDHNEDADFSFILPAIKKIILTMLNHPLPYATYLNVNFPMGQLEGMKVCRQSDARWSEEYDQKISEYGDKSYLLGGYFDNREPQSEDTDEWALNHHFGSIVPSKVDMTNYECLNDLKNLYGNIR
ncbi:MAG: 5'/3'-nucleotidase SurE [Paludibacteraceae bacterium]|nr:5'/3'-nucleotidase SurE [Paludibacteraceae bacterium]